MSKFVIFLAAMVQRRNILLPLPSFIEFTCQHFLQVAYNKFNEPSLLYVLLPLLMSLVGYELFPIIRNVCCLGQ
jgi:hypothetical protein